MILEFRIHKLKEDSDHWKNLKKYNDNNEFIVVGEEKYREYATVIQAHQLDKNRELKYFKGCKLNEMALLFESEELIGTNIYAEFDIPKQMLTLEMIEEIQRLNQKVEIPIEKIMPELQEIDFQTLKGGKK